MGTKSYTRRLSFPLHFVLIATSQQNLLEHKTETKTFPLSFHGHGLPFAHFSFLANASPLHSLPAVTTKPAPTWKANKHNNEIPAAA